jgi:formylglycine-generating enzyme required for sulfatase activity
MRTQGRRLAGISGVCVMAGALAALWLSGCAGCPCGQSDDGPRPGQNWTSPTTGMEFVWIDALKLWVGKYEVTNGEYRKMLPEHDSKSFRGHSVNGDRQPAVYVNFHTGKAYAKWLTEQEKASLGGRRYRLPSVDEWQVFAQCGDGRVYPWGNEWPPKSGQAGNYLDQAAERVLKFKGLPGYDDGHAVTAPVDDLPANPWGLHGVGGNVWEACATDSTGETYGKWRGAAWVIADEKFMRCDWAYSDAEYGKPGSKLNRKHGIRLVLSP